RKYRPAAPGMLDADRPGSAIGTPPEDPKVSSGGDQTSRGAYVSHHSRRAFRGIALADAADVDLHAGFFQENRSRLGIQPQQVIVNILRGYGELYLGRNARSLRHFPQPHRRADGNVERAIGHLPNLHSALQQFQGVGTDGDEIATSGGVDAG